jgi:hypothetical protein
MEEFRNMKTINPGKIAGLLVLCSFLILGLTGSTAWGMNKDVANNPLRDYQGLAKTATNDQVICEIGNVVNLVSNSTSEFGTSTNDWCIIIGNDDDQSVSMVWKTPSQYVDNSYLYFASLRVGYHGHMARLSQDRATNITVKSSSTDPTAISLYDTQFSIDDQSPLVPTQYEVGVRVWQNTYAWSESYRDDFIIYDWWIVNLNEDHPLDSVYVGFHVDADISTAEGGTNAQAWSRDDVVDYYRNDATKEYISYMYDGDNPAVPGNDIGGRQSPKESAGYIGSRLITCPARVGETETGVQSGHGWWDWNSDPSDDDAQAEWFSLLADGLWLDPPPSPHDYRFFQKLGPFAIPAIDSIRVMVAFGIGDGLAGMRGNLKWADSLYKNNWVGPSAPIAPIYTVTPGDNQVTIEWDDLAEASVDPASGLDDFEGYRIYRKTETGWTVLMECDVVDEFGFNTGLVHSYVDYDVQNYFQYTYAVTAYDKGEPQDNIESLESGKGTGHTVEPGTFNQTADAAVSGIHVVPNPFVGKSAPHFGFTPTSDNPATERIVFVNLNEESTIRIYSLTGDLITTVRNEQIGDQWKKTASWDLITDNMQTIVTGLYLYVVECPGHDDFIGKFAVIR